MEEISEKMAIHGWTSADKDLWDVLMREVIKDTDYRVTFTNLKIGMSQTLRKHLKKLLKLEAQSPVQRTQTPDWRKN